ncbi:MAG: hypothetical protein HY727_08110 [Candidatus Rokubacteria bacterium]|nr:hypothetical protein [Candidatus Rokubacteria bacterium]
MKDRFRSPGLLAALLLASALALTAARPQDAQAQSYSVTQLPGYTHGVYWESLNVYGQVVGTAEGGAVLWQSGFLTRLGSPGGQGWSWGYDISDWGQVVGYAAMVLGQEHAYLWQNGGAIDLGTLGGSFSYAFGINNLDSLIAGYSETGEGVIHAFLWQYGVMTDLGTLGGNFSYAYAVNDVGQVVGQAETASGELHVVVWQNGIVIADLGPGLALHINNAGQVIVRTQDGRGVLWQNGVSTDLGYTTPLAINNLGQIVGLSGSRGFIWQNGVMTDLGPVVPIDINDVGQILTNYLLLTPSVCDATLRLERGRVRRGRTLPFTVTLTHHSHETVSANLTLQVVDRNGTIVLERDLATATFHHGDGITRKDSLAIPAGLAPGTYMVRLVVTGMKATGADQQAFVVTR